MTVKELREELVKYPENTEVTVMDIFGEDVSPTVAYDEFTNQIHLF